MNRFSRGTSSPTMSAFWRSPGGSRRQLWHGLNTMAVSPPCSKSREALVEFGFDRSLTKVRRSGGSRNLPAGRGGARARPGIPETGGRFPVDCPKLHDGAIDCRPSSAKRSFQEVCHQGGVGRRESMETHPKVLGVRQGDETCIRPARSRAFRWFSVSIQATPCRIFPVRSACFRSTR